MKDFLTFSTSARYQTRWHIFPLLSAIAWNTQSGTAPSPLLFILLLLLLSSNVQTSAVRGNEFLLDVSINSPTILEKRWKKRKRNETVADKTEWEEINTGTSLKFSNVKDIKPQKKEKRTEDLYNATGHTRFCLFVVFCKESFEFLKIHTALYLYKI